MLETRTWDAADHLASPDDIAEYLSEALKDGDPGYFEHALGVVARAEGMSSVAASTGLNRENLYRTLSDDSNPISNRCENTRQPWSRVRCEARCRFCANRRALKRTFGLLFSVLG